MTRAHRPAASWPPAAAGVGAASHHVAAYAAEPIPSRGPLGAENGSAQIAAPAAPSDRPAGAFFSREQPLARDEAPHAAAVRAMRGALGGRLLDEDDGVCD